MDPYNFMELGFDVKEHTKEFYETWRYWALTYGSCLLRISRSPCQY